MSRVKKKVIQTLTLINKFNILLNNDKSLFFSYLMVEFLTICFKELNELTNKQLNLLCMRWSRRLGRGVGLTACFDITPNEPNKKT